MYDAASEVVVCTRLLAEAGQNPVTAVLGDAAVVEEWAHYPSADDVYDPSTHAQYYYHAHNAKERIAGEHGHFHTFLRPGGRADLTDPSPSNSPKKNRSESLAHLVGISMDRYGQPFRLFTTNRWVTGETWHEADDVLRMLEWFSIDIEQPSRLLNRWLTSLIRLFRPQIKDLVRARDGALAHHQKVHLERDVYEDRTLHVVTETEIDLIGQIRAIEALR